MLGGIRRSDFAHQVCLCAVYIKGTDLHMVFELCSEGDLMDYLLKKERFEEPLAAACAQSIVSAVAFCHSHHIAHRDIKVCRTTDVIAPVSS
jgi:serine/threonine protein kinase